MRSAWVWAEVFGAEQAVVEGVEFDAVESVVVARVRVRRGCVAAVSALLAAVCSR
ncbi:hypothetical protein [Micromonospora sp. NPDC023888]|uniref:hypothetical protein n=1 Tax=Micromonospora sp. NPDC023888 TaxID=3155607 RepID=UPI0033E53D97